ncbi:MAG: histidinol-phosphate transaminase [Eubacteriales bacterium]|nr:histidinol-phosphate transaminase [Eubacteriales bacterium]
MEHLLSPLARRIRSYVPGEQPKDKRYIKLNTNENPYRQSPNVDEAIRGTLGDLALYPPPEMEALRDAIAQVEGLPSRDWVYCGNGSDEVLAVAFQAFFGGDKPLLFPDITYSFYPVYCQLYGIDFCTVPLDDKLGIDFASYRQPCCGIVFPNPNAPTGIYHTVEALHSLLAEHADVPVLVDEAYILFAPQSAVSLLEKHPNLAIVRTLSKSHSLAGIRCGYIMAHPALIAGVAAVKNSFNSYPLDAMTQAGARAAILDDAYARQNCRKIVATRQRTAAMLTNMGFAVCPSQANFLFVTHPQYDAATLAAQLKDWGILVRHFTRPERIGNYLRITIGTDEQMGRVGETLLRILQ